MKSIKLLAVLCCVCAGLFFTSCQKETIECVYGVGFPKHQANGDDFLNFCNYFKEKGVPYTGDEAVLRFEGKSVADCDKQAKAFFDAQVAKLSYEEIDKFIQFPDAFYAEYVMSAASKNEGEDNRRIGVWIYPKQ